MFLRTTVVIYEELKLSLVHTLEALHEGLRKTIQDLKLFFPFDFILYLANKHLGPNLDPDSATNLKPYPEH
jgi:hypothetical protein